MERLDFDIVCSIADQCEQSFFEFGCSRTGERQHQKLFVLDVFQQKKGCQLVDEDPGLAASRAGSDNDIFRVRIVDDLRLNIRKFSEQLVVFIRGDVTAYFLGSVTFEIG